MQGMLPAAVAGYHESTKHTPERLRASRHFLDWANMPDPFRHYEGAPLADLPADPRLAPQAGGAEAISALFYYSASISAAKRAPSGYRYALRVNPSSGNLHPTEFHFAARGLKGWEDGLYHYRPSSHMAEQRARGAPLAGVTEAPLCVILTSIFWREAWKYRARAYRYVNHDLGHAMLALQYAAGAMGWPSLVRGLFDDAAARQSLRAAADEEPMLLVELWPPAAPSEAQPAVWTPGEPNRLSAGVIEYPQIAQIHGATLDCRAAPLCREPRVERWPHGGYAALARQRRSALDFLPDGRILPRAAFQAMLELLAAPLAADWRERFVEPWLFLHRVEGFEPGLYRMRDARVELVRPGDQRVVAAALSLGQDLAGHSCFTAVFVADLGRACSLFGPRGYRFVHHEAGALGQRLYLAAEAFGFRGTGIGAFYDDHVHAWLGLDPSGPLQTVYHFAVGDPVPDPRLSG
ncbi:MAG: SagB/ThcOx family dehydrogenase [Bryobacteraceae bacterium]|nr:SagB/ThcOx family dehydrogenase [Bryobacteraceae bacterium]